MPALPKILAVILIFILLVPFVFAATIELAPKYFNTVLPIVFLIIIAIAIGLYYNSTRKRSRATRNPTRPAPASHVRHPPTTGIQQKTRSQLPNQTMEPSPSTPVSAALQSQRLNSAFNVQKR